MFRLACRQGSKRASHRLFFLLWCIVLLSSWWKRDNRLQRALPLGIVLADSSKEEGGASSTNEDAKHSKEEEDDGNDDVSASTCSIQSANNAMRTVPPVGCQTVMAPSTLSDGGWGVFVLTPRKRGDPLLGFGGDGDVVIHIPRLASSSVATSLLSLPLHDYWWDGTSTGGMYEGKDGRVAAHAPGIGQLANGLVSSESNALPHVPRVDEGGLTRATSPGAGACTHYHNFSYYCQRDIEAGGEVFVRYGDEWFQERQAKGYALQTNLDSNDPQRKRHRSLAGLKSTGLCLDNLVPDREQRGEPKSLLSRHPFLQHAGRGVLASRKLEAGSVVAPVPVLPLPQGREALRLPPLSKAATRLPAQQLLINYCWGHPQSSMLLLPYGPFVSLINDGGNDLANVRFRWSTSTSLFDADYWLSMSAEQVSATATAHLWKNQSSTKSEDSEGSDETSDNAHGGLLLELVATRDIRPGEEVLVDYGAAWQAAWEAHMGAWQPPPDSKLYAPAWVHDDVIQMLRTPEELQQHAYPSHVFTACFYQYEKKDKQKGHKDGTATTTVRWNQTRGVYEMRNLRPCTILQRTPVAATLGQGGHAPAQQRQTQFVYMVQIRNRPGLHPNQRLDKGEMHVVTHVPRRAVRLTDRAYTTDAYLPNAFRREMDLPDDVFPDAWKDLA